MGVGHCFVKYTQRPDSYTYRLMGAFIQGLCIGSLVMCVLSCICIYAYVMSMMDTIVCSHDTRSVWDNGQIYDTTHRRQSTPILGTRRPRDIALSIVMTYYNRPALLKYTLDSIAKCTQPFQFLRIEVIIVDDGSTGNDTLWLDMQRYPFDIYVWRIEPRDKDWFNPCIAYNVAISKARGDWLIIQNAGVIHWGDIVTHVLTHGQRDAWTAYPTYAPNGTYANKHVLSYDESNATRHALLPMLHTIPGMWYTHHKHRALPYHFCVAVTRSVMQRVGGFNPAMALGFDFDDDELLLRLRQVTRVQVATWSMPMAIHLWHPNMSYHKRVFPAYWRKRIRQHNRDIFNDAYKRGGRPPYVNPQLPRYTPLYRRIV